MVKLPCKNTMFKVPCKVIFKLPYKNSNSQINMQKMLIVKVLCKNIKG